MQTLTFNYIFSERPSTPEENVSEEEIKLSPACSSPIEVTFEPFCIFETCFLYFLMIVPFFFLNI